MAGWYKKQVKAEGIAVKSGAEFDIESGGVFQIAGTTVSATAAELNTVDVTAAGTAQASKAVVLDANKDVAGIRNLTLGTNGAGGAAGSVVVRDGNNPGTSSTLAYADVVYVNALTATAAEVNNAASAAAQSADGLLKLNVARATYDFAEHGGAIGAIDLGVTIPDNAIVCGGFVDVVTTCTTAAADAGTMALHIQGANDLVTATAVSDGANLWDAGLHPIVPKANTPESTAIKLTAARAVTATIATQAFTAGKFTVFLYYLQGD